MKKTVRLGLFTFCVVKDKGGRMGPFVNVHKVFSFEFLYLLTDLDNVFS